MCRSSRAVAIFINIRSSSFRFTDLFVKYPVLPTGESGGLACDGVDSIVEGIGGSRLKGIARHEINQRDPPQQCGVLFWLKSVYYHLCGDESSSLKTNW